MSDALDELLDKDRNDLIAEILVLRRRLAIARQGWRRARSHLRQLGEMLADLVTAQRLVTDMNRETVDG